jgi:hypothetical protein
MNINVCRATCLILIGVLVGCVASKPDTPKLARRYHGVWHNISPRYLNWWVFGSTGGAQTYGLGMSGKCITEAGIVTGPNTMAAGMRPGDSVITLHLAEGDMLVFQADNTGVGLYKRVGVSEVCRNRDGTYLEDAPHDLRAP